MQKVALRETTWEELARYYHNVEKVQPILLRYAGCVSRRWRTSGSVLAILPQPPIYFAAIANVIMYVHVTEAMYQELCKTLEISLPASTIRKLAHVALHKANAAAQIYRIGPLRMGVAVYLSGRIFLEVLVNQARKSANPHQFSGVDGNEMKKALAEIDLTEDDVQAAKVTLENGQSEEES